MRRRKKRIIKDLILGKKPLSIRIVSIIRKNTEVRANNS
tara:strand:+ start:157 stop:273 length:117 start_codon:yes stop_codon:yes gene_type:complete